MRSSGVQGSRTRCQLLSNICERSILNSSNECFLPKNRFFIIIMQKWHSISFQQLFNFSLYIYIYMHILYIFMQHIYTHVIYLLHYKQIYDKEITLFVLELKSYNNFNFCTSSFYSRLEQFQMSDFSFSLIVDIIIFFFIVQIVIICYVMSCCYMVTVPSSACLLNSTKSLDFCLFFSS